MGAPGPTQLRSRAATCLPQSDAYKTMGYWKPELFTPLSPDNAVNGPAAAVVDTGASPSKASGLDQAGAPGWMASRSGDDGAAAEPPRAAQPTAMLLGVLAVVGVGLALLVRRDLPGRAMLAAVRRSPRALRLVSSPEEKRPQVSPKAGSHASV